LEFGRRGDAQSETQPGRGPDPRPRHVAVAVTDESDGESVERTALFRDGEKVAQNLAGVLFVGQRIDRADPAQRGEFLDIGLREGADDRAVRHAAHDARGVADGFAAAELDVVGREKNRLPAQLADTHLETQTRARRGFREHERPALAGQRRLGMRSALVLHLRRERQDPVDRRGVERLDAEEVLHGLGKF
jgi:hypothetical protein